GVRARRRLAASGRALRVQLLRLQPHDRGATRRHDTEPERRRALAPLRPGGQPDRDRARRRCHAADLVGHEGGVGRAHRRSRARGRSAVRLVRSPAVRRRIAGVRLRHAQTLSVYDPIAQLYDPWSASVVEDVSFYVDEALAAGREVVELGVGTGRIAIPTAMAGAHVIGVDSSAEMLAVCAQRAREAGVDARLDLRLGDLLRPPGARRVPLLPCPFPAYLHLRDDAGRIAALDAARDLLRPGGRLVFDVFVPSREDIEDTHGRWIEREPGIDERADWDLDLQTLTLSVRGPQGESTMTLWWLEPARWHSLLADAGFAVLAGYGWVDPRPVPGGGAGQAVDGAAEMMRGNCDKIVELGS